jgi:hypothetical protein
MDGGHHLPNAPMHCWTTHQVASTRCSAAAQVTYGFEALQEPLSRLRPFQATTVPQSIACRHVTALDGLGRFATCAVQARPAMESAWARGRHSSDVRLVVIRHDFVRNYASPLDRLAEEGLCAGGVAVLAKEDVHDHAIFINGSIQIPFLSLAEQEHLVHEPAPAHRTLAASDLGCQLGPEGFDPVEDRSMRDVNAALGQQLEDLPAGEWIGQVPANCR